MYVFWLCFTWFKMIKLTKGEKIPLKIKKSSAHFVASFTILFSDFCFCVFFSRIHYYYYYYSFLDSCCRWWWSSLDIYRLQTHTQNILLLLMMMKFWYTSAHTHARIPNDQLFFFLKTIDFFVVFFFWFFLIGWH